MLKGRRIVLLDSPSRAVTISLMRTSRGGPPVSSRRRAEGHDPSAGRASILLPILLLLLSFFLFAGWQISTSSRDNGPVKEEHRPASQARSQEKVGVPEPDLSWEERTKRWKQVLGESARTIGKDSPEVEPVTDQVREGGAVWLEIETLDSTLAAGDSVEVIWSSPDGAEWKKVTERPLTVRDVSGNRVRLKVTPEEARLLTSARSRGTIFAAPP